MADNQKILSTAIAEIEKKYGKGTVSDLEGKIEGVEFISSGSIGIDIALGGGFAKGRIVEIMGMESSGKSSLSLHAIAEVQKLGGVAAIIDAEHASDFHYMEALGVKLTKDQFIFSQPDNGEQALEIVELLVRTGVVDLIVVDSVAALTPKAEIDGEMGDSKMGLHARLMSQAMRKLTGIISKTNTCVIFINQIRQKLNVTYGPNETTSGGNALKFYASQRLDIRKIAQNKVGEEVVSSRSKIKVIKNKVAPPYRTAEVNLVFGHGIDKLDELIDYAVELEVIKKSGSWFSYGETKLGQGAGKVQDILNDNPELLEEITLKVKNLLK